VNTSGGSVGQPSTLRDLLSRPRALDARVSLRGELEGDFRRDVATLAERLPEADRSAPDEQSGWVLSVDDRYAFAVSLFALWHCGHHAVLPPNRQAGTIEALAPRTHGVLTDHVEWLDHPRALHPLRCDADAAAPADVPDFAPLARDALAVELFTSGTTGDSRSVLKSLRHLEDEVQELETIFGAQAEDAAFVSTASAQHLYGLLFGVLWPLATSRPFAPVPRNHASEIVAGIVSGGGAPTRRVLISVPSTLRQLTRHDGTPRIAGRCSAIFSSGGPLPSETAERLGAEAGVCPIEIFGSTETGGVAFRQIESTDAWTPFPNVALSPGSHDRLLVRSPFVTNPFATSPTPSASDARFGEFEMGDRVKLLENGRFELLGRADQVVKIAEKRVDLAAMEKAIREQPSVEDVRLAPLLRDGVARVAAVIVPAAPEALPFDSETRSTFQRDLRTHLKTNFDPVVLPRSWRFVPTLPTNARGKTPRAALLALFEKTPDSSPMKDQPEITEESISADQIERLARVPRVLPCFEGHFPDLPVVPGYVQLDWALDAAAALLGRKPRVAAIESLKLISPLRPGEDFRILVRCPSETRLSVEISSDAGIHAKGRLRLASNLSESPN